MLKKPFILILLLAICGIMYGGRPLKVLAIGNSFSEDATEQDLSALAAMGGHEIIIGNLYYP
ncbi:MAG: DUF4886 domain-containing protein, partial [Muribaculaceae bacterium]|nr:DUF4886 domain-containing protein [Muribaculaceae bacterium]